VIGLLAATLGACASNYPTRTVSYKETAVDRPTTPPSEAELLSVRIEAFEPGVLPEDKDVAKGLSPDIRKAEAYYIPVQLKSTMQKSGHWGPARVVPQGSRGGEVVVTGKIQESDGEILKLEIAVTDATGAEWFTKEYASVIDDKAYLKAEEGDIDPFQDLYNQIANDIAAHKKALKPADIRLIRQVAELRFGAEFAPQVYDAYLQRPAAPPPEPGNLRRLIAFFHSDAGDGAQGPVYSVVRLPAEDDPIVQRVNRIRVREEFLVDTFDEQYDGLARGVGDAYTNWRSSRLKEIVAIRTADEVKNAETAKAIAVGVLAVIAGAAIASQGGSSSCYGCGTAGVLVAGAGVAIGAQIAIKASEQASAETKLRQAALEELGQSLIADVRPTVVEVEGKTFELKGTIEEKFQAWRQVLKALHESENAPMGVTPLPSGLPATPTS
jgi:hypothetical protein